MENSSLLFIRDNRLSRSRHIFQQKCKTERRLQSLCVKLLLSASGPPVSDSPPDVRVWIQNWRWNKYSLFQFILKLREEDMKAEVRVCSHTSHSASALFGGTLDFRIQSRSYCLLLTSKEQVGFSGFFKCHSNWMVRCSSRSLYKHDSVKQ